MIRSRVETRQSLKQFVKMSGSGFPRIFTVGKNQEPQSLSSCLGGMKMIWLEDFSIQKDRKILTMNGRLWIYQLWHTKTIHLGENRDRLYVPIDTMNEP